MIACAAALSPADVERLITEGERLCGQLCDALPAAIATGNQPRVWRLERLWGAAASRTARRMQLRHKVNRITAAD